MLRNAIWFYKKPRDSTARVKRKLILLPLCVSLPLLWERGRHTYSSLAYFALYMRIKHLKYFRVQPVQPRATLSTRHSTRTEEAMLGGQHTQVPSITQQSTCHGHPCDTPGTETPTCPSRAPGHSHSHREKLHHAKGSHRPSEQSCLKIMLVTQRCTGRKLDGPTSVG